MELHSLGSRMPYPYLVKGVCGKKERVCVSDRES
jgi:hypothetical protein